MQNSLRAFELFLHAEEPALPVLVKAALAHVQFESIHPFLDGNGRLSRVLLTLLLCHARALQRPTLYLSLYLKRNRGRYYDLLQKVRFDGAWEEWLEFFLEGVAEVAGQAVDTARRVVTLFAEDRRQIAGLRRASSSAIHLHDHLQRHPITTAAAAAAALSVSAPTALASIGHLEKLGLLQETTGRRKGRTYAYTQYLNLLSEGTEPLPR